MDNDINKNEQSLEMKKDEKDEKGEKGEKDKADEFNKDTLNQDLEKKIDIQNIDIDINNEHISRKDNLALEICINIASAIIIIIGCIGGLLIAKDSVELSLASILLSLSIALILLAIKKLTVIELGIYEELRILNEEKDKLDIN